MAVPRLFPGCFRKIVTHVNRRLTYLLKVIGRCVFTEWLLFVSLRRRSAIARGRLIGAILLGSLDWLEARHIACAPRPRPVSYWRVRSAGGGGGVLRALLSLNY